MTATRSGRRVRLALFDMDDVVYVYNRADRVRELAAFTGLDGDFIERRIWGEGVEYAADGGAFPTPDSYLASWRERLGVELSADDWVAARRAGMTPIPGTFAVIDALSRRGITVAVLTNNGPLLHARRFDLVPDLARRVGDRFLVSSAFGTQKPDPEIFRRAAAELGFEPAEAVFTDDREDNVEGALHAGFAAAHVFRDPEGLAAAFAGLGDG